MIHEHALRKVEMYLHHNCLDQDVKSILDNIVLAANRGYSRGIYMVKGHFVVAPIEDANRRTVTYAEETLLPFTTESQAQHFLGYLSNYFQLRGTRVDILGIEGFVMR